MSNEPLGSLLLATRAGAMVQAVDLAASSHRESRRQGMGVDAGPARRPRLRGAREDRLGPVGAAGLMLVGFVLGSVLMVTLVT